MMSKLYVSLSLLTLLAACGAKKPEKAGTPSDVPPTGASALTLAADPGAAISVLQAKKAGPKKNVIVEGRVYDLTKDWAIMKVMEVSMDYCGEVNKEEKCPTPWDYCCDNPDDIAANSLLVMAVDDEGETLQMPAMPGMRLVDKVKITGELIKDEHGNFVLIAKGIFRVDRPKLPEYVMWPE
ncbi:MAG: hypothetical protein ACI89X_000634 [Planctomycetota bacterium]|jgi:hypothetical protein